MTSPPDGRFVQSDGARLWSTASGSGPPVICFNGGPGCDDYLEPVARYDLDEGSGTNAVDTSNHNLDGTLTGATRITGHRGGGGVR